MKFQDVPFTFTDWSMIESQEFVGERATSYWRTFNSGELRVRMVEYAPGFRSDHWCPRGHVLLVLEGDLTIELKDGRVIRLPPRTSFQVGDDDTNPHLAYTEKGATVFIVD